VETGDADNISTCNIDNDKGVLMPVDGSSWVTGTFQGFTIIKSNQAQR